MKKAFLLLPAAMLVAACGKTPTEPEYNGIIHFDPEVQETVVDISKADEVTNFQERIGKGIMQTSEDLVAGTGLTLNFNLPKISYKESTTWYKYDEETDEYTDEVDYKLNTSIEVEDLGVSVKAQITNAVTELDDFKAYVGIENIRGHVSIDETYEGKEDKGLHAALNLDDLSLGVYFGADEAFFEGPNGLVLYMANSAVASAVSFLNMLWGFIDEETGEPIENPEGSIVNDVLTDAIEEFLPYVSQYAGTLNGILKSADGSCVFAVKGDNGYGLELNVDLFKLVNAYLPALEEIIDENLGDGAFEMINGLLTALNTKKADVTLGLESDKLGRIKNVYESLDFELGVDDGGANLEYGYEESYYIAFQESLSLSANYEVTNIVAPQF